MKRMSALLVFVLLAGCMSQPVVDKPSPHEIELNKYRTNVETMFETALANVRLMIHTEITPFEARQASLEVNKLWSRLMLPPAMLHGRNVGGHSWSVALMKVRKAVTDINKQIVQLAEEKDPDVRNRMKAYLVEKEDALHTTMLIFDGAIRGDDVMIDGTLLDPSIDNDFEADIKRIRAEKRKLELDKVSLKLKAEEERRKSLQAKAEAARRERERLEQEEAERILADMNDALEQYHAALDRTIIVEAGRETLRLDLRYDKNRHHFYDRGWSLDKDASIGFKFEKPQNSNSLH